MQALPWLRRVRILQRQRGPYKDPSSWRFVVEDDVEIGALTSIDRGTIGDTHIGSGTKIGTASI